MLLNPAEKDCKNCTQECQESPGATEMVVQEPLSHPSAHYVAILLLNFLFYIFVSIMIWYQVMSYLIENLSYFFISA